MLLPFVLSSKSCLEAVKISHRQFHISSLTYYCQRVEMAKWAFDMNMNADLGSELINFAALYGALDVIEWIRRKNQNCFWDSETCCNAALNGHLVLLK